MADTQTLKDAVKQHGPFAVWDLLEESERREAAEVLWEEADSDTRTALQLALAKELKFRPQAVRRLSTERVAGRLARMADNLPEGVLFQYLFHLHMERRRALLTEFLDAAGVPHEEGVLDLPEDYEGPSAESVEAAGRDLVAKHGRPALVYLATLKVADAELWSGLDPVLAEYGEDGERAEDGDPAE